jgi:spore coat assembly protein
MLKQGDYVRRKSYGGDVIFKIVHTNYQTAILRGIDFRLLADAPFEDLELVNEKSLYSDSDLRQSLDRSIAHLHHFRKSHSLGSFSRSDEASAVDASRNFFEVPGKVLHLDGDPAYLRKSMNVYGELRVPADGFYVAEKDMSSALYRLLPQVKPDIVVITGHDGMLKNRKDDHSLSSYKNSFYFVNAVKTTREYERNLDGLTIIAGACQSHFEALLQAGANFASSPSRILIHALDPVHIASKVAYTSIKDTVNMVDVISHTISGIKGLGGIESRGSYRRGLPRVT